MRWSRAHQIHQQQMASPSLAIKAYENALKQDPDHKPTLLTLERLYQEEQYWSEVTNYCSHINVGCGADISIAELAELIAGISGFKGEIEFDPSMPDGTPRKLLDVSRLESLGWSATISLEVGIQATRQWMLENQDQR